MSIAPEQVAAASAAWNWYPDDATVLATDDLLLVDWPDWFRKPPEVLRLSVAGEGLERALTRVERQVRDWGSESYTAWVRLDAPDGCEAALLDRGGTLYETLDVLARPLGPDVADLDPPSEVEVRAETELGIVRDGHLVEAEVFDGAMPPPDRLEQIAEETRQSLDAGGGGRFVAYLDGRPVGAGGLTMADGVARLWGGGVVPDARRRGVYRAVLAARLAYAVEHGATMALVKGRVETSAPILRRAGFAAYGQERCYRVVLDRSLV